MLQKIARHSLTNWALLDQAVVSGCNFLAGILLVRVLGIEQYGVYVLLWMVVQFSSSIQAALLVSPAQSITPKLTSADHAEYLGATFWLQILLIIATSLLISAASHIMGSLLPAWWDPSMLLPLITCLAFAQMQDYSRRTLFITAKPRNAFIIDCIAYGLQITGFFFILRMAPEFRSALWISAATFGLSSIFGIASCHIRINTLAPLHNAAKRHWISSKWLLGSAILQWLNGNYFLVVAAALLSPATVGAIRAAQNLLGITHIVFQGLENIVPGQASRTYHSNGNAALRTYVKKILMVLVTGTLAMAAVIGLMAGDILQIVYGFINPDSMTALYWYIPVYLMIAACLPYRAGLRALERTRIIFVAYVIGSIFSIITANLLISSLQIHGVMLGIMAVQLIMVAGLIIAFSRESSKA